MKPNKRQLKAWKIAQQNGGNITQAMLGAGYSPNTANTPSKLTNTEAWQYMLGRLLPDGMLLAEHKKLLKARKIDYFIFPKSLSDEEIIQQVKDIGIEVMNIADSQKGKFAYYKTDDSFTKAKALELAYKLKGRFIDRVDHTSGGKPIPILDALFTEKDVPNNNSDEENQSA